MKLKHLFLIIICSFFIYQPVRGDKIQIVTFEYPPIMDSSQKSRGLMGEIVNAAFSEVNIETEILFYPAKRVLLKFIGTDEFPACIGPVALIQRQPEKRRKEIINIPNLVDIQMLFAFYKPLHGSKPANYTHLSDLRGTNIATILGSNTIPMLKKAGINVKETGIESQIRLLKAGRVDFIVIGFLTGKDLIRKIFPKEEENFVFIKKPVMELPTSIYFNSLHKRSSEYVKLFRTGLETIIKNNKYISILEKYYGKGNIPVVYKSFFKELGVEYSF